MLHSFTSFDGDTGKENSWTDIAQVLKEKPGTKTAESFVKTKECIYLATQEFKLLCSWK